MNDFDERSLSDLRAASSLAYTAISKLIATNPARGLVVFEPHALRHIHPGNPGILPSSGMVARLSLLIIAGGYDGDTYTIAIVPHHHVNATSPQRRAAIRRFNHSIHQRGPSGPDGRKLMAEGRMKSLSAAVA